MTIYIINFLTLPLYSIFIKNKKVQVYLVGFQMLLLLIFRSMTIGSDLVNYYKYFNHWSGYTLNNMIRNTGIIKFKGDWGLESGYVWLNWICAKIGLNFRGFIVVISVICIISLCRFLNKYAENKMLAMAIMISFGLFTSYFYILRQSLAISILFFSIDYIKERKAMRFFLLVFLAFLFHRSAIAFGLIYFVYKMHITNLTFILIYAGCIMEFVLIPIFYNRVIVPFLEVIGKAYLYSEISFQMNNMIVCMLGLSLVVLFLTKAGHFFDNELHRVFFGALVFALFTEVISLYSPIFSRIAQCMFFPFAAVLFSNVFSEQRLKINRIILTVSSYIILGLFYIYHLSISSIVPYVYKVESWFH